MQRERANDSMKNYRTCARRLAALLALSVVSVHSGAQVGPGYDIEMSRMIPVRDGVQKLGSTFAYGRLVHAGLTLAIADVSMSGA